MMKNAILSMEMTAYWPFWLVCICGVVFAVIAVLALLLTKEQKNHPGPGKLSHAELENGAINELLRSIPVTLRFVCIGNDHAAKEATIPSGQWCTVGSGKEADIRLNEEERSLSAVHFRVRITKSVLTVEALEAETFVNGVPIRKLGAVYAHSGDLIRAGMHEYRVIFSTCEERESAT